MSDTSTILLDRGNDAPATSRDRVIGRRRSLPGGRAVLGALLIVLAALGVFVGYQRAAAGPTTRYLVVAVDVAPGTRIDAGMVDLVTMDLPLESRNNAFADADLAIGALAVAPLRAGDLVLRSALLEAAAVPGTSTYTFALAPTRALNGAIVLGERIDVIATEDGVTEFVATNIHVLGVAATTDRVVLTVALDDPDLVLAMANAVDMASVHVARTDPDGPALATPQPDAEAGR